MSTSVAILLTAGLLLANAFFVASEFAIVKIRPTRVREMAGRGQPGAGVLRGITSRLDAYLSANQLGITLCSLGVGWLGEPAVVHVLDGWLQPLGPWRASTIHAISIGIGFAIITFLHTVIGELAPKSLALQRTETVALWAAYPLRGFFLLAYPLIWTLNSASNLCLRLLGLGRPSEAEFLHSPQELRLVVQHAKLDPGTRGLIDRVFDYTQRVARHTMVERADVVVLDATRSFDDNLKVALANQYTRYPLVNPNTDRVVGYVHLKDIFAAIASGQKPPSMRSLVREPIYCHEETRLEWLRHEMQRRRRHLAIVLGAGHRMRGIVTLEDTLEEFVGEIQDEQDIGEEPPLERQPDGSFEVDGRLTLDVVARELQLSLEPPLPTIDTLGAFLENHLGETAVPGDELDLSGFRITLIDVRDGKIRRVQLQKLPEEALEGTAP